jgi:hypothetical protein
MYKLLVKKQPLSLTVLLFVILYATVQALKPAFLYRKNGELRKFGIGYREKTIMPAWLLAIIIAIISYLLIQYSMRL